jgi:hypothetical protein
VELVWRSMLLILALLGRLTGSQAALVSVATAAELARAIRAHEPDILLVDSLTGFAQEQAIGSRAERYDSFPQV